MPQPHSPDEESVSKKSQSQSEPSLWKFLFSSPSRFPSERYVDTMSTDFPPLPSELDTNLMAVFTPSDQDTSTTPTPQQGAPTNDLKARIHSTKTPGKKQSTSLVPVGRRPRGRPSKQPGAAQYESEERPRKRSQAVVRRGIHNASARRSRSKFNSALEKLWEQVPESGRMQYNVSRNLSRTEKVEIVISYIQVLREESITKCHDF